MSKTDRIKEEIGWLKLAFGVLAAIDVSLIAWLAQNYAVTTVPMKVGCSIGIVVVTVGVAWVNHAAIRRFKELEKP